MSTSGRVDFVFQQGADFVRTVAMYDGAGALIDTAGWTARFQIRGAVTDAAPVVNLSTANGGITVGRVNTGTSSEYNLRLATTAAVTSAVADFGKGVHSLEVIDLVGGTIRLLEGFCYFSAEVVR